MQSPHPDWIVPHWPAPPGVKALITTRAGGVSQGPYASFNLGLRTGDDPQAVAANRDRLNALLPQHPRWLRQVHGSGVVEADALSHVPEADAANEPVGEIQPPEAAVGETREEDAEAIQRAAGHGDDARAAPGHPQPTGKGGEAEHEDGDGEGQGAG